MQTDFSETAPSQADDTRLQVLEMTVAAMIAQLPVPAREEVASLLCFVAGITQDVEDIGLGGDSDHLAEVRKWANAMLDRVMVSRKPDRSQADDTFGAIRPQM